ncbi:MAG: ABC transporter permease subunit [Planctomyces sp.]|nr:ABC transporter permease subunit [Planctomyces sp.]
MRAYIAILKDSFREAMASRVLWIALIGISLLLIALAPFGLLYDRSLQLRQTELTNYEAFAQAIRENSSNPSTPAGHLWSLMSESQRKDMEEWFSADDTEAAGNPGQSRKRISKNGMTRLLNDLITRPEFYNEQAWAAVKLDDDTKLLVESKSPTEGDIAFRNLRLMNAAFPRFVSIRQEPAISLTYMGTSIAGPFDAMPTQFSQTTDQVIITVLSLFLGFFGVFASLLVTATVIPRTFEPGEISLLLSKPVNRSFLFITKFLGGCAFTTLCAVLLVGGVWFLLGVRLNFWRHELLWCIPIYVFLFAIYFAVSAVSGLIWRNAIVSLIMVVLFWGVLISAGITKGFIDENVLKASRIVEIVPAGEDVFVVNGSRGVLRWDAGAEAQWQPVFRQDIQGVPAFLQRFIFAGRRYRPTWDPAGKRLLAVRMEPARTAAMGSSTIVSGNADGSYEQQIEGTTPDGVLGLFVDTKGRVVMPGRRTFYQFLGQSDQEKKTDQFIKNLFGGMVKPGAKKAFGEIYEGESVVWSASAVCAFDAIDNTIVVLDGGKLNCFDLRDDGKYVAGPIRDLESEDAAVMAVGGKHVVVALASGKLLAIDKSTLETVAEFSLAADQVPRVLESAPDGRLFAVLTHQGSVRLFSGPEAKFVDQQVDEEGVAAAIAFDASNRLLVSDGRESLTIYDENLNEVGSHRVRSSFIYYAYDYLVNPIYHILPRPSDLDNAVTYLVTGEKSVAIGDDGNNNNGSMGRENLQQDRITFDIRNAVISNVAFIVVVLGFGCLYVARSDF